ncbi:MAG: phosphoribosylformylglycinamidine synthase subunit PurS [Holosporales bacterium]|jgi:phosphoribosylformylglycinamidine synthase
MKARVHVFLKPGVLDPQGQAIEKALHGLGFDGVAEVRQGKFFDIALIADDEAAAKQQLDAMSRKLLANTVIESFSIALVS